MQINQAIETLISVLDKLLIEQRITNQNLTVIRQQNALIGEFLVKVLTEEEKENAVPDVPEN